MSLFGLHKKRTVVAFEGTYLGVRPDDSSRLAYKEKIKKIAKELYPNIEDFKYVPYEKWMGDMIVYSSRPLFAIQEMGFSPYLENESYTIYKAILRILVGEYHAGTSWSTDPEVIMEDVTDPDDSFADLFAILCVVRIA